MSKKTAGLVTLTCTWVMKMSDIFSKELLESIDGQFNNIVEKFNYPYELVKYAGLNILISPPVMPTIMKYIFKHNQIMSLDYLLSIAKDNWKAFGWEQYIPQHPEITEDLVLKARICNFYTGMLRELHVALTLYRFDKKAVIEKSSKSDIGSGAWDLCYERSMDSKKFYFAVCHEGYWSMKHFIDRKSFKRSENVIPLQAVDKSKNLHLVPESILRSFACDGAF